MRPRVQGLGVERQGAYLLLNPHRAEPARPLHVRVVDVEEAEARTTSIAEGHGLDRRCVALTTSVHLRHDHLLPPVDLQQDLVPLVRLYLAVVADFHQAAGTAGELHTAPHHELHTDLRVRQGPLKGAFGEDDVSIGQVHLAIHGELELHLCGPAERRKAGVDARAGCICGAPHQLKAPLRNLRVGGILRQRGLDEALSDRLAALVLRGRTSKPALLPFLIELLEKLELLAIDERALRRLRSRCGRNGSGRWEADELEGGA
mmetsp:Transcript_873/g.1836  ORF Transcript_873/g.1836 Transcript_873/m.1836 type:complete len:261 (-) Transcript_873:1-783(-)